MKLNPLHLPALKANARQRSKVVDQFGIPGKSTAKKANDSKNV